MTPALRAWLRSLSEAEQERFCEVAGQHLSDGVSPALADQRAMLEIIRARKARQA